MALPFVADFTGPIGLLPDPPFSKWGTSAVALWRDGTGLAIASSNGGDAIATDDSNTYTTAQKSKITVGSFGGHGTGKYYVYALVNVTGTESTGQAYWFWSDGGSDTVVNRVVGGSGSIVKTANSVTFAAGDTFEIANDGSGNITVSQNGSVISALSYTDGSPLTGGSAGAGVYQDDSSQVTSLSAWTADDVGGPITVALTGSQASGAVGSLGVQIYQGINRKRKRKRESTTFDFSAAGWFNVQQTGAGAFDRDLLYPAGSPGTVALTGVAGTSATGTLRPNISVGLTGLSGTSATGQIVDSDTNLLSGVVGTGATGTLVPGLAVHLSGVSGTGSTGTLVPSVSVALSGVQGTGQTGTIVVPGDKTVALTGVQGTGHTGTLSPFIPPVFIRVGGDDAPKKKKRRSQREEIREIVTGIVDPAPLTIPIPTPIPVAERKGPARTIGPVMTSPGLRGIHETDDEDDLEALMLAL